MVLSTAYCPPVSYISLLRQGGVSVEKYENYQKQTWRNRCNILSANGVEALQVPVIHDGTRLISSIKVDYSKGFMTRHKRAIDSAYMSSAWYEYYRDDFFAVLDARPELLWDLNGSILEFLLGRFHIAMPPCTTDFVGADVDIHPKHEDRYYVAKPYFQVFSSKYGFVPNLSAIDLLFNEGPDAVSYL